MLFCSKEGRRFRLIIYARPANSFMVKPPHTPLCSSETLSGIESMEAAGHSFGEQMSISVVLVYLCMADVDNCFRRIRISESLGEYFTFPGVFSARELGLVGSICRGTLLAANRKFVYVAPRFQWVSVGVCTLRRGSTSSGCQRPKVLTNPHS